jgi:hypothetical protein
VAVALVVLLLAAPALAGGKNLVDNPSFSKKKAGEDIYRWIVRTREGRTTFAVEGDTLVARRTARGGFLPDSCYQWINLPSGTKALRVALTVATEEAEKVLVTLRFKDQDGSPLDSETCFEIKGTTKPTRREREVLVPDRAWDLEIALVMRGAGTARFDDVEITAVDPSNAREAARVVRVGGSAWVKWIGKKPEVPIDLVLPIPPAGESQAPLELKLSTFPPGKIVKAAFDPTLEPGWIRISVTPLNDPGELRVFIEARVLVFEIPRFRALPERLPVVPESKPSRKLAPFLVAPETPGMTPLVKGLDLGGRDLRKLAERVAIVLDYHIESTPGGPADPATIAKEKRASPVGRAALGAALLRRKGVPARAISLVVIGKGSRLIHGFEAFCRSEGWLRFGLEKNDPRPLPFGSGVLMGRAGVEGFPAPLAPVAGPGVEIGAGPAGGVEGDGAYRAEVLGSFTLPKGSAPDMAKALGAAWKKALRRIRVESGRARVAMVAPELRGKAKGAKDDLAGFLSR